MSSFCSGAASSGSLSESIKADFFFFGAFFSVSLPDESLKTCLFRFSPPISDSADALRLRLPDLCDALLDRFDFGDTLRDRFDFTDPLFDRCECGVPLRERFVCGEPCGESCRDWFGDWCGDWCGDSCGVPLRDRFECRDPLPERFECCDGVRLRDLCEPAGDGVRLPDSLREWLALRDRLVRDAGVFERDLELN